MASREEELERDRIEESRDDRDDATDGVLGISRVAPGPVGEIRSVRRKRDMARPEGRITPLENETDLGARDVTRAAEGQTGPETGGHGSTPQRSGATGMDIGE